MRSHRFSTRLLYLLIIIFLTIGILPPPLDAQSRPLSSDAKNDDLRLPSLSIFGFDFSDGSKPIEKHFDPNELDKILDTMAKLEADQGKAKEGQYYPLIPLVFYKISDLFSKETWTPEEVTQGQQVSQFFARLVKNPDLRIEKSDQASFRQGLVTLRNWFAGLCQDNKTLAAMIFTTDDGPFSGEDVDLKNASKMRLVQSVPIEGRQASFVLMADDGQPQPMLIGVMNEDKSIRWLKRFTNPPNKITKAELQKPAVFEVKDYGYAVALMTEGSSGVERSNVFLDKSLDLRFYYVSW